MEAPTSLILETVLKEKVLWLLSKQASTGLWKYEYCKKVQEATYQFDVINISERTRYSDCWVSKGVYKNMSCGKRFRKALGKLIRWGSHLCLICWPQERKYLHAGGGYVRYEYLLYGIRHRRGERRRRLRFTVIGSLSPRKKYTSPRSRYTRLFIGHLSVTIPCTPDYGHFFRNYKK